MQTYKNYPGLKIDTRPELENDVRLNAPSKGTVKLKLLAQGAPEDIGDDILELAYIPSWSINATDLYRPGQKAVEESLLKPVANDAAFGGAGRSSLANNLSDFMNELEIQSMVLTGKLESGSVSASNGLVGVGLALQPEYHGIVTMPADNNSSKIKRVITSSTSSLSWQVTLKTGSHIDIAVPASAIDLVDSSFLVEPISTGFYQMLSADIDNYIRYQW